MVYPLDLPARLYVKWVVLRSVHKQVATIPPPKTDRLAVGVHYIFDASTAQEGRTKDGTGSD